MAEKSKQPYYVPEKISECKEHSPAVNHYHCAAECKDIHLSWGEAAQCNELYIHASIAKSVAVIADLNVQTIKEYRENMVTLVKLFSGLDPTKFGFFNSAPPASNERN